MINDQLPTGLKEVAPIIDLGYYYFLTSSQLAIHWITWLFHRLGSAENNYYFKESRKIK